MLVCENDDGLIIGHQCGFYLPGDLGQSVFATMLDKVEAIDNINDLVKLLQDTIQNRFKLSHTIAYHYLSADTLNKIITQSDEKTFTLRFTNIDYMNDTLDGKYGYNQFITDIKYFLADTKILNTEILQELRNYLYEGFSKLLIKNPCTRINSRSTLFMVDGKIYTAYVCSLSLDPESLPLWRNYGGSFDESYAIGIDTHNLSDICVCHIDYENYGRTGRFLPAVINSKVVDLCKTGSISKSDIPDIAKAVIEFSSAWSISHKDYYWEYENEVRFIKFVPIGIEPDGYNVHNGVFRPYINVKFDKKCLREVIVGPMVERYNAARSIDEYMGSKGFGGGRDKLHVRCSALPVRF